MDSPSVLCGDIDETHVPTRNETSSSRRWGEGFLRGGGCDSTTQESTTKRQQPLSLGCVQGSSLRIQGLSSCWWWKETRVISEASVGGTKTTTRQPSRSRNLRLSRRMRVRTQSGGRWDDCQWRTRQASCLASFGRGGGSRKGGRTSFPRSQLFIGRRFGRYPWMVTVTVCTILLLMAVGHHPLVEGLLLLSPPSPFLPSGASRHGKIALVTVGTPCRRRRMQRQQQRMYEEEQQEEEQESFGDAHVVIDDLNWRVEKLRLEEQNTQRFLKAGPRFLPYQECRKWVQAWSRWKTEEDWRQWISMGEKRNPYIPSRPDEYYGDQWISWDHFLGITSENDQDVKDKTQD